MARLEPPQGGGLQPYLQFFLVQGGRAKTSRVDHPPSPPTRTIAILPSVLPGPLGRDVSFPGAMRFRAHKSPAARNRKHSLPPSSLLRPPSVPPASSLACALPPSPSRGPPYPLSRFSCPEGARAQRWAKLSNEFACRSPNDFLLRGERTRPSIPFIDKRNDVE